MQPIVHSETPGVHALPDNVNRQKRFKPCLVKLRGQLLAVAVAVTMRVHTGRVHGGLQVLFSQAPRVGCPIMNIHCRCIVYLTPEPSINSSKHCKDRHREPSFPRDDQTTKGFRGQTRGIRRGHRPEARAAARKPRRSPSLLDRVRV